VRVVAGVVPSLSVDGSLGSTPDLAILKYAFPSKFDLGVDSRGNRFDGLSRQWPPIASLPRQNGGRVTRHVVNLDF